MKNSIVILVLLFAASSNAQLLTSDEKLHLGAGALISGTTYTIVYSKTKDKKKAFWYSIGASVLAGVGKELFDVAENETFDTGEMLSTATGGLIVSTSINLFTGKKKRKKKLLP